jgi:hypothetical protein
MNILLKLFLIGISLYLYLSIFIENDNVLSEDYAIAHKFYLFLFIFMLQFLILLITNIISKQNILKSIEENYTEAINNSLLAVIGYDVYGDLIKKKYYDNLSSQQKILMLVLLIIGFMASIKVLECLVTSN